MYSQQRAVERMREIVKELDSPGCTKSRVAELSAEIERIEIADKNYTAAINTVGNLYCTILYCIASRKQSSSRMVVDSNNHKDVENGMKHSFKSNQ